MALLELSQIIFYLVFSFAILISIVFFIVLMYQASRIARGINGVLASLRESSERLNEKIGEISVFKIISRIFKGRNYKL